MQYRKDIDGLRAIAVLPIIFYHFEWKTIFGGGFVGVDIFFVISGYLITNIIHTSLKNDSFSFLDFYERRIRRIIPAFAAMLICCIIIATYLFTGEKYTNFLISTIYSVGMISNFYFWKDGGYFADLTHTKPLVHTWSLSIEEQFYLLFPFLLWFLYKKSKNILSWLYALFCASFLLATIVCFYDANSAFFLPATRAWELLLGGIIAMTKSNNTLFHKITNHSQLCGYIGITLIMLTIISYGHIENLIFPGLAALPPCLGTALLIIAGNNQNNFGITKILSLKPFVTIGILSFSLYLAHWPIYVFYKAYTLKNTIELYDFFILCALTAVGSISSYFLIEKPIRYGSIIKKRPVLWGMFVLYASIIISTCIFFIQKNETRITFAAQGENIVGKYYKNNKIDTSYTEINSRLYAFGTQRQKEPTILLLGDSHALMYFKSFDDLAKKYDISGILSYSPHPLLGMYYKGQGKTEKYDLELKDYIEKSSFKTAVIILRYSSYINGPTEYEGIDPTKPGIKLYLNNNEHENLKNEAVLLESLKQTIHLLKSKNIDIYLITPIPEMLTNVPNSGATILLRHGEEQLQTKLKIPKEHYNLRQKEALAILETMKSYGAKIINPLPLLCDDNFCYGVKNGLPLYYDDDHLSIYGTHLTEPLFEPLFKNIQQNNGVLNK